MGFLHNTIKKYACKKVGIYTSTIMRSIKTQEDFTKAYDMYADAIFRHCYFRISDRARAEELVQETFTRTWDYSASGKGIKEVKAFLYRTANNLIVDEYRARKENASLEAMREEGFDRGDEAHRKIEMDLEGKELSRYLDKLEVKYKEVVVMRYIDELGPKEIAEILGETQNAVSVRINRGLKELQKIFEEETKL